MNNMKKKIFFATIFTLLSIVMNAQTIEQAKVDFQKENYDKAKQNLLNLYNTNKASVIALYLGNIYTKLDEKDSAKSYYQKAEVCTDAYAYIAKAKLAIMEGKDEATITANIDKAISLSKRKDAEVYFQAGFLALDANNKNKEAYKQYFEQAITLAPANNFYKLIYGDLYLYLPEIDKGAAMDKYDEVLANDPNNILVYIRRGRLLYSGKGYAKAIEAYEKGNKIDSSYAVAYKDLGEIYTITKDTAKALYAYERYVKLNEGNSRAKALYGSKLYQFGKHQKVINLISEELKTDPQNIYYLRLLTYSNFELKNSTEAYKYFNTLVTNVSEPKLTVYDNIYGAKIALANNDTAKSLTYYTNALKGDTTNAEIQSEYAKLIYLTKNYPQAIIEYNKRLKMKRAPLSIDYFNLGRAYYFNKDYVNADTSFGKFLVINPESPDGYLWRAKCNLTKESTVYKGYAAPYYEKYITYASNTPENAEKNKSNIVNAYTYLGYVAKDANDKVKAKTLFNKVLALEPSNANAKAALAALAKTK